MSRITPDRLNMAVASMLVQLGLQSQGAYEEADGTWYRELVDLIEIKLAETGTMTVDPKADEELVAKAQKLHATIEGDKQFIASLQKAIAEKYVGENGLLPADVALPIMQAIHGNPVPIVMPGYQWATVITGIRTAIQAGASVGATSASIDNWGNVLARIEFEIEDSMEDPDVIIERLKTFL